MRQRSLSGVLAASVLVALLSPALSKQPKVVENSCDFYRDAQFKGPKISLEPDASGAWRYNLNEQTPQLDKKVSSAICAPGCSAMLFEKRDQQGATKVIEGAAATLGSAWNDKARSVEISCPMTAAPEGDTSDSAEIKYRCTPKVTVTMRFEKDATVLFLKGLSDREEKLENTRAASGSEYVSADAFEGDAVTTVFLRGDDAEISIDGPKTPRKEWRCKDERE
jgi:membrane-bound inhibitor of C-type lysozyme